MPFDTTKLRQPTVTVLPPTPPERGEGPRRIVVNIEIVERRAPPQRRSSMLWWWLLLFLAIALAAHAEGQRYEHWQDTTTGWHGQTRTEGRTTDWDAYGPDGRQRHCHRYYVGDQPYTTCR
jgi:hypothetical protein